MSLMTGLVWVLLGGSIAASLEHHQGATSYTLVINEFMARNDSAVEDPDEPGRFEDWLEIYNYGDTPIDLAGFYLTDDLKYPTRCRIPGGYPHLTTVPSKGYRLIWADSDPEQGPLHLCLRLKAKGGEDIGLFAPDEAGLLLVDALSFSEQDKDASLGRLPDGSDHWQAFKFESAAPPSPGQSNSRDVPEQLVVINEIMYHPWGEDNRDEYLELYNRGDRVVNLEEWRLSKGISYEFDKVLLEPGAYLIVAAQVDRFLTSHPDVGVTVVGDWQGKLSNRGETIRLMDSHNNLVDSVSYYDEGAWAQRHLGPPDHMHRGWQWHNAHDGEGESLELINPRLPNEYGQNWAASLTGSGTPGSQNSVYAADAAPIIQDVSHFPVVPNSTDEVTIQAAVPPHQEPDIASILYWRIDTSAYVEDGYPSHDASSYHAVPMLSTQAGLYTAAIPPQEDRSVVEFYVAVEDAAGNRRTFPPPNDVNGVPQQVTNLLYQVDESYAADMESVPQGQPVYRLVMTRAEHDRLADIGDPNFSGKWWASEAMTKAEMNATFISLDNEGTQVRYNVGVRNRGNRSRFDPPMNYHVSFRNDLPWQGKYAVNLNSKYTHCQVIASAFYQMAGLPAQNAIAVQLRVNGTNPAATDLARTHGSYAALQVYDGLWAQQHAPDDADGNLYRCTYDMRHGVRTFADLTYQGRNPANYWENYHKKTNEELNDWNDIFDLTYALNDDSLSDGDYVGQVGHIVNIEQWTRFWAADTLVGNREKGLYSGMGDDYALYSGVNDRRFRLVPHDLDTVLGQGDEGYHPEQDILSYQDVPGLYLLINHPDVKALYYEQLRHLTVTLFTSEVMDPLIDEFLAGWVSDEALNGAQGMKQFVRDRLHHVMPQVPPAD